MNSLQTVSGRKIFLYKIVPSLVTKCNSTSENDIDIYIGPTVNAHSPQLNEASPITYTCGGEPAEELFTATDDALRSSSRDSEKSCTTNDDDDVMSWPVADRRRRRRSQPSFRSSASPTETLQPPEHDSDYTNVVRKQLLSEHVAQVA